MGFWILAIAMTGLVAAALALAVLRPRAATAGASRDVAMYRDQLAEVDRDVDRGVLAEDEAERVRVEVGRRLLEADRRARGETAPRRRGGDLTALAVFLAVAAGGVALYLSLGAPFYRDLPLAERLAAADRDWADRPSQDEFVEGLGFRAVDPSVPQEHLDLLTALRDALAVRPDDLTGYVLLAQNEARIGRFVQAAEAQAEVLRIKGAAASASDYADYADLLVLAAGGYVSPEAETVLRAALDKDPRNGVALYYSGLMFAQGGRFDRAMAIWQPLLLTSSPDDPWVPAIEAQIADVSARAGIRFELPERALPGPGADDIAAAGEMSETDQQAMIEGMVAGLADRLATVGGPPQEWARLITSLGVLDRRIEAEEIWREARVVFADQADALDVLDRAASQAGLTE